MKNAAVDFSRVVAKMKAQQSLSNTPLHGANRMDDVFNAIKPEYLRISQPARGYGKACDVPYIFCDFSKDENDPGNYYFQQTDEVMDSARATGAKIIYRLGAAPESTRPRIYCKKPDDFEKWARICANIAEHVNADGRVEYFEIWDEPDVWDNWENGTCAEYCRLYETAARTLKARNRSVKVGGPAASDIDFCREFAAYVNKRGVPLDFFTYHCYEDDLARASDRLDALNAILPDFKGEKFIGAWNCADLSLPERALFRDVQTMRGAAYDAGFMILAQEKGFDASLYFNPQPSSRLCGFTTQYNDCRKKPYFAFEAFARLKTFPDQVAAQADDFYILAAKAGKNCGVYLSNFDESEGVMKIKLSGTGAYQADYYLLDENRDMALVKSDFSDPGGVLTVKYSGFTVAYVDIKGR